MDSGSNPYQTPVDTVEDEDDEHPRQRFSVLSPSNPGKVACFWLVALSTLNPWAAILSGNLDALPNAILESFLFFVLPGCLLFVGVELVRKLVLLSAGVVIFYAVSGFVFLLLKAGLQDYEYGPALIVSSAQIRLGHWSATAFLAILSLVSLYPVAILWGRRCDGSPLRTPFFSSRESGARESHHGKSE